jgi:hypothetical protein
MGMTTTSARFALGAFWALVLGIDLAAAGVPAEPQPEVPSSQPGIVPPTTSYVEPPPSLGSLLEDPRDSGSAETTEGEGDRRRREGERDEIETDRDSFTPATTTSPRGRLIAESAYSFIENRGVKDTHSFPELVLRYGLTERLELRLGWNYEVGGEGNDTSGSDTAPEEFSMGQRLKRESNLSYGMKIRLTEQKTWVPASAVILQAFTPTSGPATVTQFAATYVFGWELPRRWKLDAAIRYVAADENDDHFNEWAPSIVLKVPIVERLSLHAEYFGLFSTDKAAEINHQYFSPGAHYLITPDLEVGFRLGWGLNEQTPRFFSNVGLGWRF